MSNAPGDEVYTALENKLEAWRDWRDALSSQIRDILEGAAFGGTEVSAPTVEALIEQANVLLGQVRTCSADTAACVK